MKLFTVGMFILCILLAFIKLTSGSISWVRVFLPLIFLVVILVIKEIARYLTVKADRKRNLQIKQRRR